MKTNIINGIKPVNDVLFKSCYYHQLIAGLAAFGIEKDIILLNSFSAIGREYKIYNGTVFSEKYFERLLGYERKNCNIDRNKLIKCVDKGKPVIVGVDSYYLESRQDTYHYYHVLHFILVYGYDLDNDKVNVVDHDYVNSKEYKEKTISLNNLLYANKMLRKGKLKRKKTCYILNQKRGIENPDAFKAITKDMLINNKENAIYNVKLLSEELFDDRILDNTNIVKISDYLNDIKKFYFLLSITKIFENNEEQKINIISLASAYSNILSLLWKFNAQKNQDYILRNKDKILQKLNFIIELENKVCMFLLEEKNKYE